MKCAICGKETNRKTCPYCSRKDRWEGFVKEQAIVALFPPRIQRELLTPNREDVFLPLEKWTDRKGLYLYGEIGCGKTVYGAHVTVADMERCFVENTELRPGSTHIYQPVPNLLQEIRDTFKPGPEGAPGEKELIDRYSFCNWLFLDDLGVEKVSLWVLQTLYVIINNRYEYLLPTIITSNLSLDLLSERLQDDRIPSRISEMALVYRMDGPDRRVAK